jgi:hypothetical protein
VKKIVGLLLIVWLLIGVVAAAQRGYLNDSTKDCASVATIAINVVAGPLNYVGVDPEVDECDGPNPVEDDLPQPSEDES